MRRVALFASVLILSGCNSSTEDLQAFVAEVQASIQPDPLPVPEIKPFTHKAYTVDSIRSPFQPPAPELAVIAREANKHCLQPDNERDKFPLEKFSLENLTMRGTLEGRSGLWVLIEADDANLYRTKVGEYLGLFNGRITKIKRDEIEITELLPDGTGCWQPRSTQLTLKVGD